MILCICISLQSAFAHVLNIDSVYQKIASEKDESKRLKELNLFFGSPETKDLLKDIQYAQRILVLAQKNNDKISEALAWSQLGADYVSFGNNVKA